MFKHYRLRGLQDRRLGGAKIDCLLIVFFLALFMSVVGFFSATYVKYKYEIQPQKQARVDME